MEVPNGILIVAIWATLHLISEDVKVLVDGQGVVGIACGNEVGHGTRWNTQSAEDCAATNDVFAQRLQNQHEFIGSFGSLFMLIARIVECGLALVSWLS